MQEITRYQQLRPAQKIAEEETLFLGLNLYPDNNLSELAINLAECTSNEAYNAIYHKYKEKNVSSIIRDLSKINPVVRKIYDWINFKAKPLKADDFLQLMNSLDMNELTDLKGLWYYYADNLVLSIIENRLSVNYCVDFQLLIRICHLLNVFENRDDDTKITAVDMEVRLNELLKKYILLPKRILRSRCCDDCSKSGILVHYEGSAGRSQNVQQNCNCKCDESCQPPSDHCICIRTYVSDLYVVKEQLARYEEGDIADIENILAGEKKVRRFRTLQRAETTNENETNTTTSDERDNQVSEKLSLQSEVKKTVDSKIGVDAGVSATLKYGDTVTLTPHANVTANFSKSESQNTARSYAKDIIDRSVTKMEEKVRTLQISKIISEQEERNKHSIDNTLVGSNHRAGIYYWVNKVSHAQVFNYGKHTMFDVIVPEPAALFKALYALKNEKNKAAGKPSLPVWPLVGGVALTPAIVTPANYGDILNAYAISTTEELQPPETKFAVQIAFSQNLNEPSNTSDSTSFSSSEYKTPPIPDGYKASTADYDVRCATGNPINTGGSHEAAVSVTVGKMCILNQSFNETNLVTPVNHLVPAAAPGAMPIYNQDWVSTGSIRMNGEQGVVTVAVAGFSTLAMALSGTVSINCDLTTEAFQKWQARIFNLVMTDYNRRLTTYNGIKAGADPLVQIKGRNPFLNREIERNEFKRHVIAILMCNYFNGIGSMMEKVAPCGYPEIDFLKLEKNAPIIQFFEQVFEWNYMNYVFYHSMWARKCKWPELIDEDSGDPLFDKFLMAGAARVQVPIRPGMEHYFCWFLKTKQIWNATSTPPLPEDEEFVSMIQELREANQGDYMDRPGSIEATKGSDVLLLTDSSYYWDNTIIPAQLNVPNIRNDIDREILVDYELYRIVKVEQTNPPGDILSWSITIERPYEGSSAKNLKHAVGALFVGTPWEIVIPTKLVYLRNTTDKLPVYPLT
ncbi:MAG: hypothetical protein JNK79_07555 [Chitinophagaceae bacterium]|nr:hypothetical protein [Chitinophagaceae bacterium]